MRLPASAHRSLAAAVLQAISAKLGISHPSLADVAAAAGCPITLAATSLARRAPVYLSSTTHPDMPVRDALRGAGVMQQGLQAAQHSMHGVRGHLSYVLLHTCASHAHTIDSRTIRVSVVRYSLMHAHSPAPLCCPYFSCACVPCLRPASCAIPFFFTPLRGPGGDLLVDGCISDCAPLAGLRAGVRHRHRAAEAAAAEQQQPAMLLS
jgi:hypothetical protein